MVGPTERETAERETAEQEVVAGGHTAESGGVQAEEILGRAYPFGNFASHESSEFRTKAARDTRLFLNFWKNDWVPSRSPHEEFF